MFRWFVENFYFNDVRISSLQETRRLNKEMTFLGQLGQGRHARVRLVRLGEQYRAVKMFETRFLTEFERERTIFQTDLLEHPNLLGQFVFSRLFS